VSARTGRHVSVLLSMAMLAFASSAVVGAAGGCATTVIVPAAQNPATVYLVDHGRHTSMALPAGRGMLVQYSYGDWAYYALGQNDLGHGICAMLCSRRAALGRRIIGATDDPGQMQARLRGVRVTRFQADAGLVQRLRQQLDRRFASQSGRLYFSHQYDTYFVIDREHYSVLHNCNHVTARWLEQLGCQVRGLVMFSDFRLIQQQ